MTRSFGCNRIWRGDPTCGASRGFALVVALGLMSLVLVLSLAMSLLLQVERVRRQAGFDEYLARQNALLGMRIALASVQSEVGSDQAVTARADILEDWLAQAEEAGEGNTGMPSVHRYWTGAFSADRGLDEEDLRESVRWMVSGDLGGIEGLMAGVGSGVSLVTDSNGDPVVVAPLVSVPQSGAVRGGGFAYHVADEGIKAKVNLINPHVDAATGTEENYYQFLVSQRFGFAAIGELEALDQIHRVGGQQQLRERMVRLNRPGDLGFMAEGIEAGVADLDFTTYSLGLLTDGLRGGLRRDLTGKLSSGNYGWGDLIFPEDQLEAETRSPSGLPFRSDARGPSWSLFQDYYRLHEVLNGNNPEIVPRQGGNRVPPGSNLRTSHGERQLLAPVLVYLGLSYGLETVEEGDGVYRVHITLEPIMVLWNPYDVRMAAADYLALFRRQQEGGTELEFRNDFAARQFDDGPEWRIRTNELLPGFDRDDQNANSLHFAVRGLAFEPGEYVVLSLPGGRYDDYPSTGRVLERGNNGGYISLPLHANVGLAKNAATDIGLVDTSIRGEGNLGLGIRQGRSHIPLLYLRAADDEQDFAGALGAFAAGDVTDWESIRVIYTSRIDIPRVDIPVSGELEQTYLLSQGYMLYGPQVHVLGISDSGIDNRFLVTTNPRAGYHGMAQAESGDSIGISGLATPAYILVSGADPVESFDSQALFPRSAALDDPGDGSEYRAVLFHLPREELFSVGQFQHLDVGRYPIAPTYAVGNSYASPWIYPEEIMTEVFVGRFFDHSYLYNDLLWDRYYFSTWRPTETAAPRNARLVALDSAANVTEANPDYRQLAAYLMVDGPFNVNSTSVDAWVALLSGMNQQQIAYTDFGVAGGAPVQRTGDQALQFPFLRSPTPTGGNAVQPASGGDFPAGVDTAYWRGFRELTSTQVRELASEIVAEVKLRGPFRTVGEFMNRKLAPASDVRSLAGAVQAAIDRQSNTSSEPINPVPLDGSVQTASSSLSTRYRRALAGVRHGGAPGYLTQADVVSPLGPVLTARSDTFIIRSYGEAYGGSSNDVVSRARCEAVVQRVPDYLDDRDKPWVEGDELSAVNQRFGRRFVIVSLRWLTEAD